MSLLKRASRGYAWSQAGRLAEVTLLFVLSLLLARQMGPARYGVFALGMSLVMFCGFLSTMGLGQETLGKFVPEAVAGRYPGGLPSLVKHLFSIRILAVTALGGIVLLGGRWLEQSLGMGGLRSSLGWIVLVFALRSVSELFTCVFSGLLELRVVAAARSIVPLVGLGWIAGCVLQGKRISVNDAFVALFMGQLAALLILSLAAKQGWPSVRGVRGEPDRNLRRVLSFGLFAWLSGFFIIVLGDSFDVVLIGWLIKDAKEVGFYSVGASTAYRTVSLLLAWLPLMGTATACSAYLEGGKERLAETAEAVWKLIAISLVPAMFLLFRFADPLVTLLYSEGYRAAVPVLRVLAALLALSAILGHGLHAGILYILDREKSACAIFAGSAICNTATGIVLVKAVGIVGAAWATGFSFVFFATLCLLVGRSAVVVRWPRDFIARVLVASFVGSFATLWMKSDSLPGLGIAITVWALVFLLVLGMTKPLSAKDSSSLRKINPGLGYVVERLFARPN
jgi:O-antigen/teichoic acid export membrane protein